jgi:hypothetical protein
MKRSRMSRRRSRRLFTRSASRVNRGNMMSVMRGGIRF